MHRGLVHLRRAAIPLIACAILVYFRHHSFDLPLETDEANYAYIGSRLLQGDQLYVDVWDHQPPGVFMLFAGVIGIFGDSPAVFRWLAVAFSITSLVLMYAILRRISGLPAAVLGIIIFSVVSSDPGTGGEGVNREIYMNTLVLAAWWLATWGWRPECDIAPLSPHKSVLSPNNCNVAPTSRNLAIAAAGLCLGLASLLKTNVAVYWFFLAAWIVSMACLRNSRRRVASVSTAIALFSSGPALIWAGTLGYFAATGRLRDIVDAVFLVNLDYADTQGAFLSRFATFFTPPRFPHVFDSAYPLWLGAAAALAWLFSTALLRLHPAKFLMLGLAGAAYLAVCLPGRFWPHYYYLLIPPAVMAMTLFIVSLLHASAQFVARRKRTSSIAIVASGVIVAVLFWSEYNHYLSKDGIEITMARYNTRDYWGKAQGENVARVTSPGDSVFVYGNDAAIYYYSGRKCASRYTMITGLHPEMRGFKERRRRMLEDLRAARPRLILVVFDQEPFEEWKAFLNEEYGQPVGWDFHDERGKPIMFVLARKDAPIPEVNWDWDRSQVQSKADLQAESR